MFDLVIQNGMLVDGSGASRPVAYGAVEHGRVAEIARIDSARGRRTRR